ncbi:MAG: HAD family hydrolase [Ruminococcus sp.]|nr:HAD family hydrolase [Ruminococcus sp.]
MALTTVLFDLDGTLLPMDQEEFVNAYFSLLAKRLAPMGYEPKELVATIWAGTKAMLANKGSRPNDELFWSKFVENYGVQCLRDKEQIDDYYNKEFLLVKDICGFNPKAAECVHRIKEAGFRAALATQPIFPRTATEHRTRWAGLQVSDFELVTTYENINYCKPSKEYYLEICRRLGVSAEECLMVGNDVDDDMPARDTGMQVFLLTDCLINHKGADINEYPHGGFDELLAFLNI